MPRRTTSLEIDAPAADVFDLIHDYDRRLDWDSMLSSAEILGDADQACVGVRTLCTGTWRTLWMPMETEYVQFVPGEVAAVKLTNRPPFFERFAATIRHADVAEGRSRVTYIYSFRTRPRFLAWLLEPIMDRLLARETRSRLASLRDGIGRRPSNIE